MANKYYGVKKGKTTGVFYSWEACKAQVDGVSGAEYKSFKTEQEAKNYVKNTSVKIIENEVLQQNTNGLIEAYVDGSYHKLTKEFSYGMVILRENQELKFGEKYDEPELAAMHNVAGEIKGAEAAMKYALQNELASITIYHDYEGIAKWCLGEWKTNKDGTKKYKAFYDSIRDKVTIRFVKVTGHSNNKYNDIADELAKQALGLIDKKHEIQKEEWKA